jgi:hypothetical protein
MGYTTYGKVILSLCLIKHHDIKTYRILNVQIHTFLATVINRMIGQLHAPTALPLLLPSTVDRWRVIARVIKYIVSEHRLLDGADRCSWAPGDVQLLSGGGLIVFQLLLYFF